MDCYPVKKDTMCQLWELALSNRPHRIGTFSFYMNMKRATAEKSCIIFIQIMENAKKEIFP
jgi:hypothetical protein